MSVLGRPALAAMSGCWGGRRLILTAMGAGRDTEKTTEETVQCP